MPSAQQWFAVNNTAQPFQLFLSSSFSVFPSHLLCWLCARVWPWAASCGLLREIWDWLEDLSDRLGGWVGRCRARWCQGHCWRSAGAGEEWGCPFCQSSSIASSCSRLGLSLCVVVVKSSVGVCVCFFYFYKCLRPQNPLCQDLNWLLVSQCWSL